MASAAGTGATWPGPAVARRGRRGPVPDTRVGLRLTQPLAQRLRVHPHPARDRLDRLVLTGVVLAVLGDRTDRLSGSPGRTTSAWLPPSQPRRWAPNRRWFRVLRCAQGVSPRPPIRRRRPALPRVRHTLSSSTAFGRGCQHDDAHPRSSVLLTGSGSELREAARPDSPNEERENEHVGTSVGPIPHHAGRRGVLAVEGAALGGRTRAVQASGYRVDDWRGDRGPAGPAPAGDLRLP